MSSYEDYRRTSRHYDQTRVPIGIEIILGCLSRVGRPLAELTVLDAGCGTGAYTLAMIDHVGRVEAVDQNEGMLAVARDKLASGAAAGRVRFHRASIDALPIPDGSVDAVMVNQVLHHLGDDASAGWPQTRRVMRQLARVLRPGGVVVVNICSHEQLRDGAWYCALLPAEVERMCAMHVPLAALRSLMTACGLRHGGRLVPVDAMLQGEHCLDPQGPFDQAWRDGDSIWALVSEDRLEQVLARLRQLRDVGELETFVAQHDVRRREIGQVGFTWAIRD